MLVGHSWYFFVLIVALIIYWRLENCLQPRLAFTAITGFLALAFLLSRAMSPAFACGLLLVLLFCAIATYRIAMKLAKARSNVWFWLGLVIPFFALVSIYLGTKLAAEHSLRWLVPISVGFFALRAAHFIYESYRGGIKPQDFLSFVAYLLFFPTMIAGPLERFPKFIEQLSVPFSIDHLMVGAERILIGSFKKFILADILMLALLPPQSLSVTGFDHSSWATILFACVMRCLYVYFDFAGYSDMAIGTGRLFGFKLVENFDYPLLRSNLAEFWRAWHRSLSSFARDYVYFPLLAKYRSVGLASIFSMIAVALWHGVSPGWLLWGMHHGIGLTVLARFNRFAPRYRRLQAMRHTLVWRIAALLFTWFYVALGFSFTWSPENFDTCIKIYSTLLTFGILR